jgi:two-component system sensor histidine kinase VicK
MSPTNLNYTFNSFKNHTLWFFCIFAGIIAISSCQKKKDARHNDKDYTEDFKPIFSTVNKLFDQKKTHEGIFYLDSAFNTLNNPSYNDRFGFYALHFMYTKKELGDAKKESLYADSMFTMAYKCVNKPYYISDYAQACFAKGDAYNDLNQYNEAYKCFYEGYFVGKNYLDNTILAEYTYRLGMVMYKQSHFGLAANYFKESYRKSFAYDDNFRGFYQRQELLNDIGESYLANGDIDSAELYFTKTLAYLQQNDHRFKGRANMLDMARAVVYGDQASILIQKKQYNQAQELLLKSIDINLRKSNDNYNAELVEINLAQLYLNQHRYGPFINVLNNLHNQLDSVKNTSAEADRGRLMSSYYSERKDFAKAYQYFEAYSALKDSLVKASTSLKETDVNQQVANYDKQYQIENLKDDNNLQLIYLYLAIICVIMAIVIIFLVYRNWKRSKNDILAVSALNKQISSQKTELENTLDDLKVSSQEKDRILRTVAHDLRNPIGGIVSLTNAMQEDEYTDEQMELIKLVNLTSNNSLELINEILEATNTTKTELNKELVEINTLVNNSVEILGFRAAEKNQKIITELLLKPQEVLLSREKIWRVISNLISNAIKFSPDGSTIGVKAISDEKNVVISVTDNGIGIPDDIKDEVFNIFTNAKRPGTAGEKSFGLGLSICQQIIESHQGKIWFESSPKSTSFYISLPAV